jgi:hypothetical protein
VEMPCVSLVEITFTRNFVEKIRTAWILAVPEKTIVFFRFENLTFILRLKINFSSRKIRVYPEDDNNKYLSRM